MDIGHVGRVGSSGHGGLDNGRAQLAATVHQSRTDTACAARSGRLDSESGSNGRGCSCRPGRLQLRSRVRVFCARAAPALWAVDGLQRRSRLARCRPVTAGTGSRPWSRRSRRPAGHGSRHPPHSRAASGTGFRGGVGRRGSGFQHPISRPRGRTLKRSLEASVGCYYASQSAAEASTVAFVTPLQKRTITQSVLPILQRSYIIIYRLGFESL